MSESSREAFEKWYLENVGDRLAYEPKHHYYLDDTANDMWQAWQGGHAAGVEDERERAKSAAEAYRAANPLGGPASMFEAMAARIRAGEDYYAVLADYGMAAAIRRGE